MLKLERRDDTEQPVVRVRFSLPLTEAPGPVSVIGDFNGWDPFAHPMKKQEDGTRSVEVDFPVPSTVVFKYLASGGVWFDEPDADRVVPAAEGGTNSVLEIGGGMAATGARAMGEVTTERAMAVQDQGMPPERPSRVVVESLRPSVDGGRFPAKASVGEVVPITADVFGDGHDVIAASAWVRPVGGEWLEVPMTAAGNDRFEAVFVPDRQGRWELTVSGWVDRFTTWAHGTRRKVEAGQDVTVDLLVGAELMDEVASRARTVDGEALELVRAAAGDFRAGTAGHWLDDAELASLVRRHAERRSEARVDPPYPIVVDRPRARFSAWYELFPRSTAQGAGLPPSEPGRHGTLRDVIDRLDYVAGMGFDVLYLPPIHPIGRYRRKGPNNDPEGGEDAVGSPWAIGSEDGGHTAIHPELGTFDDFRALVDAARARGMEVALDLAFQCSPDHPWVREHPQWFRHRPDGTIQHAENPPKKYEDIVPIDFETDDWRALWAELRDVVRFWVDRGVRIFRVDNPHTKPFAFWQWLIETVKADHPDVLFLSEAFTRPRVMERLAKVGFTQSYTYFAWRNGRDELEEYFRDLTTRTVDYFRPNAWPNTPDILTELLQHEGRPAFVVRAVLASTLCANWGVYGPAFELVEHTPVRPGSEEYLDSEKYQLRHWDLDRPESLAPLLTRLNRIRKEHPALQQDRTLFFHGADDPATICYSKVDPASDDTILVVVNLDPRNRRGGWVHLHVDRLGLGPDEAYDAVDLLGGGTYAWQGGRNYVELDPAGQAAHVLWLRRRDPERPA